MWDITYFKILKMPLEPGKFGRRSLKGFAYDIAHQFSYSAEHYAWMAYHYSIPVVTIDLLTLQINPPEFDIARNRNVAGMLQTTLLRNSTLLKNPGAVVAAILTANLLMDDNGVEGRNPKPLEMIYTVTLTDDRGKEWIAVRKDKWSSLMANAE
jgi:hypothetical protein